MSVFFVVAVPVLGKTQVFLWVKQTVEHCTTLPLVFNILMEFGGKTISPCVILVKTNMLY